MNNVSSSTYHQIFTFYLNAIFFLPYITYQSFTIVSRKLNQWIESNNEKGKQRKKTTTTYHHSIAFILSIFSSLKLCSNHEKFHCWICLSIYLVKVLFAFSFNHTKQYNSNKRKKQAIFVKYILFKITFFLTQSSPSNYILPPSFFSLSNKCLKYLIVNCALLLTWFFSVSRKLIPRCSFNFFFSFFCANYFWLPPPVLFFICFGILYITADIK